MKYTPTPDGQELGGFTQLPANRYTFVLDAPEEQPKKGETLTGKETGPIERVRIPFKVNRGEYAGQPIAFFAGLSFPRGMQDYLKIIAASGAAEKLSKSYGLPPIAEGWDDSVIKSRKLFNALRTVLPGLEVDGDVKQRSYEVIVDEASGKKETRTNSNIVAVYPPAGGIPKAASGGETKAPSEDW